MSQRLVMAREIVQMLLPKPRHAESRVPDCPVGADAIHCGINPVQQGAIMELSELIAHYTDAWNQPDRARREQLLELVWDEQGTYTDPLGFVAGRGHSSTTSGRSFSKIRGHDLNAPARSTRMTVTFASTGAC